MIEIPSTCLEHVLSFVRRNDDDTVFAVLNLSDREQTMTFVDTLHHGTYADFFTGDKVEIAESTELTLEPWGYRVYVA